MIKYCLYKVDQSDSNILIANAFMFALLLASWIQYNQHGWINPDSVLYFEQARRFVQGDIAGMLELFNWPLYPICIGLMHQLTQFSLHVSAQLLNVIFFGLATFSFLQLIKLIGGNQRTLFFAAALLFSSQYIVGDVLEMLMRDEGFWAFYLSALVFFVRFAMHQQTKDALLWQVCMVIAMLFRLEAITYLLLLPIVYFLTIEATWKHRAHLALHTYSLCLVFGVGTLIYLSINPEISFSQFGRLDEVFDTHFYASLTEKLFTQANIMAKEVLGHYLREFAVEGLLFTFAFVLISKSIVATGCIPSLLAYFGYQDKYSSMTPLGRRILVILLTIGIITASLIIIKRFVLSKRYLVALVWVLLIFASFQLSKLSQHKQLRMRFCMVIIGLVMVLGFIKNVLPKDNAYNFRQNTIHWLNDHKGQNDDVFYDDNRMIYFANAPFIGRWTDNWLFTTQAIKTGKLKNHDWLVLSYSIKHPEHLDFIADQLPEYKEVKRFANRKQKKFMLIYQRKSQTQ